MNTELVTSRTAASAPHATNPTKGANRTAEEFAALLSHASEPTASPEPISVAAPPPAAVAPTPMPTASVMAGTITPGTIGALLAAAGGSDAATIVGTLSQLIGPIPGMTMPVPPTGGPSTEITLSGDMEQRRAALQPLFEAAGARYGVDPDLLAAVAWTESSFQPDVVSHAGAIGLMQIMPGTAGDLGVDPRDPAQAIDGAARYLRDAFEQFGDVRLALAAYNAGPGAVASHGGIPPYPETTAYVVKVMDRYESLRGAST
jgi:hypothetical protein